jgi:hypothetical protein
MSRKIETAETGSDFIAIGRRSPNLKKEHRCGSHWTGVTDLGSVTVADHNRELPPYVRQKIRKEFIAIGLAIVVLSVAVLVLLPIVA